jgi:beta-galactosidase
MDAGGSSGVDGSLAGAGGTAGRDVGACLAGNGGAAEGYVAPAPARSDLLLDDGWRFLRSDVVGAGDASFDDASWTAISLPHTWNALDGQDGGNDYYRGTGWYRRHVVLPASASGKKVYLQFDGSNTVTDVYVNGTPIGEHRGGYARFRFDVTASMQAGADNVIAVEVSNAPFPDVPPLDADFTFFGGLYRDVHLLVTDPVHIDTEDYGSDGVYLETSDVSATSASLLARVRVRNGGAAAAAVTVKTTIVRADGAVETTLSAAGTVAAGRTQTLAANTTIACPHLWNGTADPYLYAAYAELEVGGQTVDWVAAPLGFRSYSVDASLGFFLNGAYLDLHGVDRHQDRLNMGWAITDKEHDEDMALIREMGANIVRLAHYQHAQHFYDLADRAGIVVWSEIPLVNAVTNSAAFTDNAVAQMTELIRQNFNHPAVVFWGIGNEQRNDDSVTNSVLSTLASLVRSQDRSRLSTYASCCVSDASAVARHGDVSGYNKYYGWYEGQTSDFGPWADALHAANPTLKIGVSEYGAGASISQHQDPPAQPPTAGPFHPEEWQTAFHEATWTQMKSRRFLWGKMVWNMFDFASDGRSEGDTPGRNDKGLVTYDRKTRKDAFYWYKANWTTAPFVYITSRRFTPRTTATANVKVYSNTEAVALAVNGADLGAVTSSDHVFVWRDVALLTGDNTLVATAGNAGTEVIDTVIWTRQ